MTKTTKSNLITVTMAIGILSIGVIIGFSAYLQPAEAGPAVIPVVTALIANLLTQTLGGLADAELLQTQINTKANSIFGLETDGDFGLEAIDNEVEHIETELHNSDYGLEEIDDEVEHIETELHNSDYGLEEIDDEVEHNTALLEDSDFGLNAQVNDEIYGLKRLASDVQHDDWGLEIIDDEIEVIDAKISKQLAKQRVEISVIRADNDIYLQTSESGKAVEVEIVSMQLVSNGVVVDLDPTTRITEIVGITGLYLLDPGVKGGIDGIYVQVQHLEDPIEHASLLEPIPVDHFGSILITNTNEKTTSQ